MKYVFDFGVGDLWVDGDIYLCIQGRRPSGESGPLLAWHRVQLPAPALTHDFLSLLVDLSVVFTFSIRSFLDYFPAQ